MPVLIARINDRTDALRMSIANALGTLRDGRAVRPLIELILRDPAATVRAQAAAALGRIGDATSLPMLIVALGDVEHWVRLRALEAIEAISPLDTSAIEVALGDHNREVRHRAALALERLGALDLAFGELGSDDETVWTAARDRLVSVGRAGLSERLTRHVDDALPRVRARVVGILGALGDPSRAEPIIKALADQDAGVRLSAIAALGVLGGTDIVWTGRGAGERGALPLGNRTASALIPVVKTGSPDEREAATEALLRHEPSVLAVLEAQLAELAANGGDHVRAATLRVLAVVPGDTVDACLRVALSDPFVDVKLGAVRALGARRVTAAAEEIGPLLVTPDAVLGLAAAEALGAIGGSRAVQLLVAAMPSARAQLREVVCTALAGFGWDAAYPTFDVLLASDDLASRLGAVWTLGKTADPRAVPILRMLLHEPAGQVRSAAAGALGKIDDPAAVAALVDLLADPNPFVRSATSNALGIAKQPPPATVLAPLLLDPDPFVRTRAVIAIGRIGGELADAALAAAPREAASAAILALGRGLTGTEAGVAAALTAVQDPHVRAALERQLSDELPAVRQQLFANLKADPGSGAELDVAAIVASYISTLTNSSDVDARRLAARAIRSMQDAASTAALAAAVRHDPDREVRRLAAASLDGRSDPTVRAALYGALHDPDPGVRLAAIQSLRAQLTPRDAGCLFEVLASPNAEVARAAESALTAIHLTGDGLALVLDWMMAQEAEALVCAGLRILTTLADSRSLGALQALVRSSSSSIRLEAIRGLAALGMPEGLRAALGAIEDPSAPVRAAVVRALQRATRADVIDALGRAASDPAVEVRVAVCETLGTLDTVHAAPLLAQLAVDRDTHVSTSAVTQLFLARELDGLDRLLEVWPLLTPEVRARLKESTASAVPRFEALIANALDPTQRHLAIRVLAAIDATAHAARIAVALGDPDGKVRLAAVQALGTLESERVGDWLERVFDDPVAEVRTAARRAKLKVL